VKVSRVRHDREAATGKRKREGRSNEVDVEITRLISRTAVMSQRNSYWGAACGTGRSGYDPVRRRRQKTKSAGGTDHDAEGHEA
jgi:hypothetical protein